MDLNVGIDQESCTELFRQAKLLDEVDYDKAAVGEKYTPEDLAQIVKTSYTKGGGLYDKKYKQLIDEAIKENNVHAVSILWKGVYYYDRDNPHYEDDVWTAAKHGNLNTFKFVLYGFQNHATLNPIRSIRVSQLVDETSDPEVKEYLQSLTDKKLHARH